MSDVVQELKRVSEVLLFNRIGSDCLQQGSLIWMAGGWGEHWAALQLVQRLHGDITAIFPNKGERVVSAT